MSVGVRTRSPERRVYKVNEISELSSYYIPAQYLYVVGNPARTIRDVRDRKEENEIRKYVPRDKFQLIAQ